MRVLAGSSVAVRLAVSSLFWSTLILLVAGLALTALYRRQSERAFDERLLAYANDLAADLVAPADGAEREPGALGEPRFQIPGSGWYWRLGRLDGGDERSSRSLRDGTLPALAPADPERPFGGVRTESAAGPEGRLLRVVERDVDAGEDGRFVVRVAAPTDEVASAQARFTGALVATFLTLGAALGLSTLLGIRFGLGPLFELKAAVAAVRRGQAERIAGAYPKDVAPLADELNLLLDANREILERARTQVGNLAHALKTPLSVIVNEADGGTDELAVRVREQAALMRDQVEWYLNRARAAASAGAIGAATEVEPVLGALLRTFGQIYGERRLSLALDAPAGTRFLGERQDLEEMAGNLVDNACKWARSRVEVSATVDAAADGPALRVVVDDDGPGLPEGAEVEALKRGRRLDETVPGSGLGLSIAAELALHHRGRLELGRSPLGGVRATLELAGDGGR